MSPQCGSPDGWAATVEVVVPEATRAVAAALRERDDLVSAVGEAERGTPGARLPVTLLQNPFGDAAPDRVPELRAVTRSTAVPGVLVGGQLAEGYDTREAAERDNLVVVPVVLAVVVLILVAVLRSLLMPALLLVSVVLSFAAALGTGIVVSDVVFGFATQGTAAARVHLPRRPRRRLRGFRPLHPRLRRGSSPSYAGRIRLVVESHARGSSSPAPSASSPCSRSWCSSHSASSSPSACC